MKHSGKAMQSACNILFWTFVIMAALMVLSWVAGAVGVKFMRISKGLPMLWVLFAAFTFYFFRDPEARVPSEPKAVVSVGHGTVDVVDEVDEPMFMCGRCKRISTFLSVADVHVQNTPVAGRVRYVKHTSGKFLNAMAILSATENENVLVGIESSDRVERVGVRLIAGLIARRIVPWVKEGEEVARGERMSLIQFGSRVDIYLPMTATIRAKPGDRVTGGETVVAMLA